MAGGGRRVDVENPAQQAGADAQLWARQEGRIREMERLMLAAVGFARGKSPQ